MNGSSPRQLSGVEPAARALINEGPAHVPSERLRNFAVVRYFPQMLLLLCCVLALCAGLQAVTNASVLASKAAAAFPYSPGHTFPLFAPRATAPLPHSNARRNVCIRRSPYAIVAQWNDPELRPARVRRLRISTKHRTPRLSLQLFQSANMRAEPRPVQQWLNCGRSPPVV
jgi:hypothetical protein